MNDKKPLADASGFFVDLSVLAEPGQEILGLLPLGLPKTSSSVPTSQMTPWFMYTTWLLTSRAIATRCFWPPEICRGQALI